MHMNGRHLHDDYMEFMFKSWIILRHLSFFANQLSHFMICLDFYLVVKTPFSPQKERNSIYLRWIILLSLIKGIFLIALPSDNSIQTLLTTIFYLILYLFQWYFIVQALFVMSDQGTSVNVRRKLTMRYAALMLYYSLQVFMITYRNIQILKVTMPKDHPNPLFIEFKISSDDDSIYLTYSVGICTLLLIWIRVTEPFIAKVLLNTLRLKNLAKKYDYEQGAELSFLNSSINIEYVVIILEGITAVLRQREQNSHNANDALNSSQVSINLDDLSEGPSVASTAKGSRSNSCAASVASIDATGENITYRIPQIGMLQEFDLESRMDMSISQSNKNAGLGRLAAKQLMNAANAEKFRAPVREKTDLNQTHSKLGKNFLITTHS